MRKNYLYSCHIIFMIVSNHLEWEQAVADEDLASLFFSSDKNEV